MEMISSSHGLSLDLFLFFGVLFTLILRLRVQCRQQYQFKLLVSKSKRSRIKMSSLFEIDRLIAAFDINPANSSFKHLSFLTSANLIKYENDYYDKYIPDGRLITGTYDIDNDWIIVYQAFNQNIAEYAVKHQKLTGNKLYSLSRMTWIKSNFLWMMYRSDWAQKDNNQTKILAIFLRISDGFVNLLKNANKQKGKDKVNLQWDPHHLPNGDKVATKRAIQLGLKGSFCTQTFHENIIKIEDITNFVNQQYENRMNNLPFLVPLETVLNIKNINCENNLENNDIERIKLGQNMNSHYYRDKKKNKHNKKRKKSKKLKNIIIDIDDDI
eukprot:319860_1